MYFTVSSYCPGRPATAPYRPAQACLALASPAASRACTPHCQGRPLGDLGCGRGRAALPPAPGRPAVHGGGVAGPHRCRVRGRRRRPVGGVAARRRARGRRVRWDGPLLLCSCVQCGCILLHAISAPGSPPDRLSPLTPTCPAATRLSARRPQPPTTTPPRSVSPFAWWMGGRGCWACAGVASQTPARAGPRGKRWRPEVRAQGPGAVVPLAWLHP